VSAGIALPAVARATPPTLKRAADQVGKAGGDAVNCLFVAASVHSTLLKVTMPLPRPCRCPSRRAEQRA